MRALAQVEADKAAVEAAKTSILGAPPPAGAEAMNGAQAQSFQGVLAAIRLGEITAEAAKVMLPLMFPSIGGDVAEAVVTAQALGLAPSPAAADGGPAAAPSPALASAPATAPTPDPEDDDEDTTDPATYDPDDADPDADGMAPDLDDALDDAEEAVDAGDDLSPEDMRDALRRLTEAVRARRERRRQRQQREAAPRA